MTSDQIIVACDLRRRIEQLEAFANHAEQQAANPPARVTHVELFAEDRAEHARDLRRRISQLREELQDVEGQRKLALAHVV